jgi:molybdopterin-guanine dinucleotide biosynthesis protein A
VAGVEPFDAVILAGGSGRRLGGLDKGGLVVAGLALLDRVLLATQAAERTVVVGERRPTPRPVDWTRENPPGGGPLAGLQAGLAHLYAQVDDAPPDRPGIESASGTVVVLATDLPRLAPADVVRLLAALSRRPEADAALFSDSEGRSQPLAAAYRVAPIRAALAAVEPTHGKAVKLVLHQLAVVTVPDRGAAGDCDTPEQLAAARAYFDRQG